MAMMVMIMMIIIIDELIVIQTLIKEQTMFMYLIFFYEKAFDLVPYTLDLELFTKSNALSKDFWKFLCRTGEIAQALEWVREA